MKGAFSNSPAPSCVRLLVGSRVADATIKNRLEQLKNAIRNEEALSELAS